MWWLKLENCTDHIGVECAKKDQCMSAVHCRRGRGIEDVDLKMM